MATGRTICASCLTDVDKKILELCEKISNRVEEKIKLEEYKKDFINKYGKISKTRDAGAGRGGGKLQRDALCVRGRQGKAPYSNRNLRWHPLVVAAQEIDFAKPIKKIEIEGEGETQTFVFFVEINGETQSYRSDEVHLLPERYVILPEHWEPHIDNLKTWNDVLWTQNSCVIPAMEACDWWDAVGVYAFLAISVAIEFYDVSFEEIYNDVKSFVDEEIQHIKDGVIINLPNEEKYFRQCPVCLKPISDKLKEFRKQERIPTWQPAWRPLKKEEGEDGSNQILHIEPLIETEIRHKIGKVKFGHRWCNIAMTDHSLEETLDFFEYIVKSHKEG